MTQQYNELSKNDRQMIPKEVRESLTLYQEQNKLYLK